MASSLMINGEKTSLEELPARQLARSLMQLPARQRLEVIMHHPDAEAVVGALAEQDFYFFVKEIGREDAPLLLSLARIEQLDHLFDLEWWQKDGVLPARALDWLDRLMQASDEKLLAWLYHADFELLVTLFRQWLTVLATPEDVDPLEASDSLPPNTLDDQYFWEMRYPQYEDFIKRFLGLIFEVHYGFYKELMSHVVWAGAGIEEEAYRFHRARLDDHAIPDFYEALEIYRAIRPAEIEHRKQVPAAEDLLDSSPSFALALVPEQDLLGQALREVRDEPLLATLQMELAALANKVVVADRLSPDTFEDLRRAVDKTAAYVNFGLQLKSPGGVGPAREMLAGVYLEHLFRLGQAQVARLRGLLQQVRDRGWISRWPGGLKVLDGEWLDSAELLLGKTPSLLRASTGSSGAPPTEDLFRTKEDLVKGKHVADVIISVGPLFEALLPDAETMQRELWAEAQVPAWEDATLGGLIWTAAASFLARGEWVVEPISPGVWSGLFPRLEPGRLIEAVQAWAEARLTDEAMRAPARDYLATLYESYEAEMAPFFRGEPADPRMVKFFLFKEE